MCVKTFEHHVVMLWWPKTVIWEKYAVILTEITATSLRIMGNIHPNPNHLSESPHATTHNRHHELKLYTCINHVPLKRNETIFCDIQWRNNHGTPMIRGHFDWNHDYISPNHGKHQSESSGNFSVHLSESCVRKNIAKIYKSQTTVHVAKPHADEVAAKVIINRGREMKRY